MGAVFWAVKRHWLAGPGPKLVLLDEAWASLRAGSGSEREFESGVREGRKGMTVYGLATQFVADMDTDLARPIMAQVETRFYLPDGHAKSEAFAEHYRRAGLTPHQLWQLSKDAKAKRDYLYQATNGETRLLRLPLEGAALAICGASSRARPRARAGSCWRPGVERGERFTRLAGSRRRPGSGRRGAAPRCAWRPSRRGGDGGVAAVGDRRRAWRPPRVCPRCGRPLPGAAALEGGGRGPARGSRRCSCCAAWLAGIAAAGVAGAARPPVGLGGLLVDVVVLTLAGVGLLGLIVRVGRMVTARAAREEETA